MGTTVTFTARLTDQVSAVAGKIKTSIGSVGEAVRKAAVATPIVPQRIVPVAGIKTEAGKATKVVTEAFSAKKVLSGAGFDWLGEIGSFHKDATTKARESLEIVNRAIKQNQSNTQAWSSSNFGAFARLRSGISGIATSWKQIRAATSGEGAMVGKAGLVESLETVKSSFSQIKSMASPVLGIFGSIGSAAMGMGMMIAKWAAYGATALGAMVAAAAGYLAKMVVSAANLRDTTSMALEALFGGVGTDQFERVIALSDKLKSGIGGVAESMKTLGGAGFTWGESEEITKRLADLKMLGKTEEQIKGATLPIMQMKASGVMQGDEMRQFAENAGIGLSLVMQAMSQISGKSIEELNKMRAAGKVSADLATNAMMLAIKMKTGNKEAGLAATEAATRTLSGAWDTLLTMPEKFAIKIAKLSPEALEKIRKTLASVVEWFGSDEADTWVYRLSKGFDLIVNGAGAALGVVQAFALGIGSMLVPALADIDPNQDPFKTWKDPTFLAKVREFGEGIGQLTLKLIDLAGKIESGVVWLIAFADQMSWLKPIIVTVAAILGAMTFAIVGSIALLGGLAAVAAAPFVVLAAVLEQVYQKILAVKNALSTGVIGGAIAGAVGGFATGGVGGAIAGGVGGAVSGGVPGFAEGGPVAQTGMAQVHGGEYVVPRGGALVFAGGGGGGGSGGSVTIPVNIQIVQQPGESGETLSRRVVERIHETAWENLGLAYSGG